LGKRILLQAIKTERLMNKRNFLLGSAGLIPATTVPALAANSNRITRKEYDDYVHRFNSNDMSFIDFYHPDVVLELGVKEIVGNIGIRDFYANVKKHIKETVTVNQFISDEGGVAVEIPTTFECFADWDDSFWGIPLKKGQVQKVISFGFYQVVDHKFKRIKAARYKMVQEWSKVW
jgi:hypothetical protein